MSKVTAHSVLFRCGLVERFGSFHSVGIWTKHRTLFTSPKNLLTLIFLDGIHDVWCDLLLEG